MARNNSGNGAALGFEKKLWDMADQMRGHMDPAEYKHVVLGLIFLKYISEKFETIYDDLAGRADTHFTDPIQSQFQPALFTSRGVHTLATSAISKFCKQLIDLHFPNWLYCPWRNKSRLWLPCRWGRLHA